MREKKKERVRGVKDSKSKVQMTARHISPGEKDAEMLFGELEKKEKSSRMALGIWLDRPIKRTDAKAKR